jgi:preprotein translocase subunit SecD
MIPLKKIFTSWRVILLLTLLVLAVWSIQPHFFGNEGATIRSVVANSSASNAGMQSAAAKLAPLAREKILFINGEKINTVQDYYTSIEKLGPNRTVKIDTSKSSYNLITPDVLPNTSLFYQADLGLKVYDAPSSNLRKGLDLEGGTRVLLKPSEAVSQDTLDMTVDTLKQRLNVYGLSDIIVRTASDLSGDKFILIEIAGVTEDEVKNLLASQGKFEAKIGNETVFFGGKKDITYVCRSAQCSGIDPRQGCFSVQDGYACGFFFAISLSPEAAERQAALTNKLSVVTSDTGSDNYLSDDIVLFLDDKEVDRLKIGAELKGKSTTEIQISGSGAGPTEQLAVTTTLQNMKRLQTIIITGSLPVKLDVVKMDTISPSLGKEFLSNVMLVGILAILAVSGVVLVKYRKIKIILPMVLTIIAEMILILGFAAMVGWNLDLAAIAAIIIVAGTAVDHLIVITDETLRGEAMATDWKLRIKNAMFIIMGAYLTGVASMIPLWFAGAGMLKGFAFTTIVGISFGVLVARPAYAAVAELLLRKEE